MRTLAISHQRDAGPGVFAEAIAAAGDDLDLWSIDEDAEPPADPLGYDAVMTFGGAMNVDQPDEHAWIDPEKELLAGLIDAGVPLLGVCLGSQLVCEAAGGAARRAPKPEIGWHPVEVTADGQEDPLLRPLAPAFEAFQWHSYEGIPPEGATILARSAVCVQAYRVGETTWGIQSHPEVSAADAAHWIEDYRSDPDAVRLGTDPAVLGPETAERIATWNEIGRDLCLRFLDTARELRGAGSSPG
jgi:GMP synthase-like glutamine amidotransferase